MVATTTTRFTADEFFAFTQRPENQGRKFELVRGEVVEVPLPTRPQGVVCARVACTLDHFVHESGLGYVAANNSGVLLHRNPDTVRGPDVAVYNDASTFQELHTNCGTVPPLLAVEVLSPSDRTMPTFRKVSDYLFAGTRLVWVIDPEDQAVIVYRSGKQVEVLDQHGELSGEDVLPGFTCRIGDFFRIGKRKQS